jgi:hypothetical protein
LAFAELIVLETVVLRIDLTLTCLGVGQLAPGVRVVQPKTIVRTAHCGEELLADMSTFADGILKVVTDARRERLVRIIIFGSKTRPESAAPWELDTVLERSSELQGCGSAGSFNTVREKSGSSGNRNRRHCGGDDEQRLGQIEACYESAE